MDMFNSEVESLKLRMTMLEERFESFTDPDYVPESEDEEDEELSGDSEGSIDITESPKKRVKAPRRREISRPKKIPRPIV